MSQPSQGIQSPALPNASLNPETIKALTEKLLEFVQALAALNPEEPQEPAPPDIQEPAGEADQIRCYRVPSFMVAEEREILSAYQADDVVELLQKARDDFSLTTLFMRRFQDDFAIDGPTVQHIGESLARPLIMLNKACSILVDYEPQAREVSD